MTRAAALLVVCSLLGSCSGSSAQPAPSPSGTYLVVAIDYHFHNAHPTPPLSRAQTLVVENDSVHVHNVTVVGTHFSQDVQPFKELRISPLRSVLSTPGRYRFYCSYHVSRGMKGVIVIR